MASSDGAFASLQRDKPYRGEVIELVAKINVTIDWDILARRLKVEAPG